MAGCSRAAAASVGKAEGWYLQAINGIVAAACQQGVSSTRLDMFWAELDLNQRRQKPADLQSAPINHSGIDPACRARRLYAYGLGNVAVVCANDLIVTHTSREHNWSGRHTCLVLMPAVRRGRRSEGVERCQHSRECGGIGRRYGLKIR